MWRTPQSRSRNVRLSPTRRRRLHLEQLEHRRPLAVFTVTNTLDSGPGSLRSAILSVPEGIHFNIPVTDPGHVYYRDNGVAGSVNQANVTVTSAANDADIRDIDPDWAHSWYSIRPNSALPQIAAPLVLDGYTQPGSAANTNTVESRLGLNTVLRIELDGSLANFATGLQVDRLANGSTIRGLALNRFHSVQYGIHVAGGIRIEGNFIGTDVSGTLDLGNGSGVVIDGEFGLATDNVIGGTVPAARNLISGNSGDGVTFQRNRYGAGHNNRVQGNLIGTDRTGAVGLANGSGISVAASAFWMGNLIGGDALGAGNVISGNTGGNGINLNSAIDTIVQGNFIGTDVTGTRALGNNGFGVTDFGSRGTRIGGPTATARNVISGHVFAEGVNFNSTSGGVVQGNYIGTDVSGTLPLGNRFGVGVGGGATGALVGGSAPGEGNLIAFNGRGGVVVDGFDTHAAILGNSIFSNTDNSGFGIWGLGIDLNGNGVTGNDPGDVDSGNSNNLQNFPVLTSVETTGSSTTIHGTLDSTPGGTFTVQFFAIDQVDPSGHGEGQFLLGTATVVPDAAGNFTTVLPVGVSANQFVTATATDANNNTSEFSAAVGVNSIPTDVVIDASTPQSFLDQLTTVSGSVFLVNVAGRTLLILPNLQFVGADFIVTGNPDLTTVAAPQLGEVGGDLNVSDNPLLGEIDVGATTTVGGDFTLNVPSTGEIDVGGITTVGGDFSIDATAAGAIDVGALTTVGGNFTVHAPSAGEIDVGAVTTIGGDLTLDDNDSAGAIDVGGVTTVGGTVSIASNNSAGSIDVSAVTTVGGSVNILNNPAAITINFHSLQSILGSLFINGNLPATVIDLTALAEVSGSLAIVDNPSASTVDLGGVTTVGGALTFSGNTAATTVDLDGVTVVGGDITISGNTSATTVDLGGVTSVGGDVTLSGNTSASAISLVFLNLVSGAVTFSGNISVLHINLDALVQAGSIAIVDNHAAQSITLRALESTAGDVTVSGNDSASLVDLGTVSTVGGDVTVANNSAAVSVDLGTLSTVAGDLNVSGNDSASALNLGTVASVGGDVTVSNNPSATAVDLGTLSTVAGDLNVTGNDSAEAINLGTVSTVGGDVTIADNPSAGTVDLGTVSSVAGDLTLEANQLVTAATADGDTTVTLLNAAATMQASLISGTFVNAVSFSVEQLAPADLPPEPGQDATGDTATIDPLFAYQFNFAMPTLNQDASLTFEIDVADLSATDQAAFLAALAGGNATVAVKNDSPGSVYQAFALCAPGQPPADGCVALTLFDANHNPLPAGSTAAPAFVRFDGVAGHFSTYAVVTVSPNIAQVESIVINDGGRQRSMVNSLTIVFDRHVAIDPGAFELYRQGVRKPIPVQMNVYESEGQTVVQLTFKGRGVVGGSLANGQYQLIVRGDKIHDDAGRQLDGDGDGQAGGNYVDEFFRRFGDTDGDGDVDRIDKDLFFTAYGKRRQQPGYLWYLDYNANGRVWKEDLAHFPRNDDFHRGR